MHSAIIAFMIGILGAPATCPKAVTDAAAKAYPDAKQEKCKREEEKGKVSYEVKLVTKSGEKIDLDISEDGKVLGTETVVDLGSVPKPVLDAFQKKYPGATAKRAEKQVKADGATFYELAWEQGGKRHEATFGADGKFVEEE